MFNQKYNDLYIRVIIYLKISQQVLYKSAITLPSTVIPDNDTVINAVSCLTPLKPFVGK